jgi:hypothetical protein
MSQKFGLSQTLQLPFTQLVLQETQVLLIERYGVSTGQTHERVFGSVIKPGGHL